MPVLANNMFLTAFSGRSRVTADATRDGGRRKTHPFIWGGGGFASHYLIAKRFWFDEIGPSLPSVPTARTRHIQGPILSGISNV